MDPNFGIFRRRKLYFSLCLEGSGLPLSEYIKIIQIHNRIDQMFSLSKRVNTKQEEEEEEMTRANPMSPPSRFARKGGGQKDQYRETIAAVEA